MLLFDSDQECIEWTLGGDLATVNGVWADLPIVSLSLSIYIISKLGLFIGVFLSNLTDVAKMAKLVMV